MRFLGIIVFCTALLFVNDSFCSGFIADEEGNIDIRGARVNLMDLVNDSALYPEKAWFKETHLITYSKENHKFTITGTVGSLRQMPDSEDVKKCLNEKCYTYIPDCFVEKVGLKTEKVGAILLNHADLKLGEKLRFHIMLRRVKDHRQ